MISPLSGLTNLTELSGLSRQLHRGLFPPTWWRIRDWAVETWFIYVDNPCPVAPPWQHAHPDNNC